MDAFQVLLDAPGTLTTRLQVAQIGDFNDRRYGDFSITKDDVATWERNLSLLPGQRAPIDLDHSSDKTPRKTEAAGWITGVGWDGEKPMADVEWTPLGESAIREKRFLFFSPSFGPFKDEHGAITDNVLTGGALTNKPFLSKMPTLSLASDDALRAAMVDDDVLGPATRLLEALSGSLDSRRTMPTENTDLLKLLDLPEDADDAKILEAVTALKTPGTEAKTLDQQAADAGKTLLDLAQVTALVSDAQAGRVAANKLLEMEFESAFGDAIRSGRAAPAQRDQLKHFYTLDQPSTLKMLQEGPQIVRVQPTLDWDNSRHLHADGGEIPVGVHPGSHSVHEQILKTLEAENLPASDYTKVYDRLTARNI